MDYCENETEEERCGIIESFVAICQSNDVATSLCDWPEIFGCAPACGPNQHWETCSATASGKYGKCICKEGFVFLNGKCVTENQRGCVLPNGLTVSNSWEELSNDCQQKCSCQNNQYFCKPNNYNLSSNDCVLNSFGEPYCRPNRPSCWPNCSNCIGPGCEPDKPCNGPNCEPDDPRPPCVGPNCEPDDPRPPCVGPNCEPDDPRPPCVGPNCEPDGPRPPCIGPNCPDKPTPTPGYCTGPNCPDKSTPTPGHCTGSNCPDKPTPTPGHCTGSNCHNHNNCSGPECSTPKPDPEDPDGSKPCTGSNCSPTPRPCTGPNCLPTPTPTPQRPKPPTPRPPVHNTGYCRIHSDPHIETFDKNRYDLMGTCLYTAVKPTDSVDEDDDFEISFKNYRPWYNSNAAMVESVFIKLKSATIHLKVGPLSGRYPTRVYSYIGFGFKYTYLDHRLNILQL